MVTDSVAFVFRTQERTSKCTQNVLHCLLSELYRSTDHPVSLWNASVPFSTLFSRWATQS